jgi:hypothetical protein
MMKCVLNFCKTWCDFSIHEKNPLLWVMIGPLFIALSLTLLLPLSHLSSPSLPLLAISGVILSWKWRVKGLLAKVLLLFFSLLFSRSSSHFLWNVGWGCFLMGSVLISFFAMEEWREYYRDKWREKEREAAEAKLALRAFRQQVAVKKRTFEKEEERLKEEVRKGQEERETFLCLVDASRVEAEKVFKQNEMLSVETLEQHRKIASLELKCKEMQDKLEKSSKEIVLSQEELRKQLQSLNSCRVELFQARLLLDANPPYPEPVKKMPPRPKIEAMQSRGQMLILQTLKKDEAMIKTVYDQILSDHTKLAADQKKLLSRLKGAKEEGEAVPLREQIEKLQEKLEEKKEKFTQTKAELTEIKKQIFLIKKGVQENATTPAE